MAAVVEARRADAAVRFVAERAAGPPVAVEYEDRTLRLEVDDERRTRLESLLSDYHVFKVEQPATRTADPGVVYLSAVTDPKHLADFVESLFRDVYGAAEDYPLRVE